MVKRSKRLKSVIEGYKTEIENHFKKLEKDIIEGDEILARYHVKEIDKSLIATLEYKINLLGRNKENDDLIKELKNRLEKFKIKLGIED